MSMQPKLDSTRSFVTTVLGRRVLGRVLADGELAALAGEQAADGARRVTHRHQRRVCHLLGELDRTLRRLRRRPPGCSSVGHYPRAKSRVTK
eukprot:5550159-Prymnesium_polylepis.1